MNILENILKTREQKLLELQAKIRARDEAIHAVTLAKQLAKELPLLIQERECAPFIPHLSQLRAEEDAVPSNMLDMFHGIAALKRLLADLPEITAFWEARVKQLSGSR